MNEFNKRKYFDYKIKKNTVSIIFKRRDYSRTFTHFYFCSRVLNSFVPDQTSEWIKGKRLNAYIFGWSLNYIVAKKNDTVYELIFQDISLIRNEIDDLEIALDNLFNDRNNQTFDIIENNIQYNFNFTSTARKVAALCVLWDNKPHPRDHLEINIKIDKETLNPTKNSNRTYGDPSKCVDELRNEGFPRESDLENETNIQPSLEIYYDNINDQRQQHYRLTEKKQNFSFQRSRGQISTKWKKELFALHNNTCQICHNIFSIEYLAPDHKVPVIVDNELIDDNNFKNKLQTVCVRCNQVKRESCKKCPYNKNCEECEWAFPEKYSIDKHNFMTLKKIAKHYKLNINQLLNFLINKFLKKKFVSYSDDE